MQLTNKGDGVSESKQVADDFAALLEQLEGAALVVLSETEEVIESLLEQLEDAALVIRAMYAGTLPTCFAPTLEMVTKIDAAIARAKGLQCR